VTVTNDVTPLAWRKRAAKTGTVTQAFGGGGGTTLWRKL